MPTIARNASGAKGDKETAQTFDKILSLTKIVEESPGKSSKVNNNLYNELDRKCKSCFYVS